MQFTLNIELGNDAMRTGHDIKEAVRLSFRAMSYLDLSIGDSFPITDANGNTVGKWEVIETPLSDPIERMYEEAFAEGEDSNELCECGRHKQDCIAFDNGDSFQHGDR